ncbi:TIGR03986 family CRISPR-associated RAMP protein [Nostoc sp. FACHB-145]|uniref:TIGR03986 family type III CRISPR-associated RAMP protein n=1 Tax=Nostoc sp. FACHB-145 TaxID=2692836 RepID=UPI001688C19E|nr:TIGR03986 family CRISPR-associated RAMP protein [Nostoc sp. FACHB-145]MBD2471734.1 TIGR03986 family CRISPR-associated RAMP protein [Nostoc sp. FACHB-145]
MNPRHISKVPDERKAIAPYNFVELPEDVVKVALDSLPQENRYYQNRYTGRIECTLTTESPLYIRCGLTKEEFNCNTETKNLPDFFYTNPLEKPTKPVIPGSSLRGMLRNLVEIVSFSKIDQVSDNQHLFFRAVAASSNKDSLGKEYKQYISPKNIEAGYLSQDNEGWYIQPAKVIENETFAWVREKEINLTNIKKFNDGGYHPQYISISYETVDRDINDRAKRLFVLNVDLANIYKAKGVLVTSGNMKQGSESSPRRNHCVVFEKNTTSAKLRIDDKAIEHYRNALTDFQKLPPFDKNWGMLNENCSVVFYYPPQTGNKVGFFGQSPNFRIPYSPEGNGQATTVVDFIPSYLNNRNNSSIIDLADAIFGWVKEDKNLPQNLRQRGSRVYITDAKYKFDKNGIWYKGNPDDTLIPQILSEPKPTCFQHYLVQPNDTKADQSKIKHYASQPKLETVIRGHKLYWHKGIKSVIQHPEGNNVSETQITKIKPINREVTFKFSIYFENFTDIELGTILWILDISQSDKYRLKLGMGKPLGMGAVKIESQLYLSDRTFRYSKLFDSNEWSIKENNELNQRYTTDFVRVFEEYILDNVNIEDYPQGKKRVELNNISSLPRIEMLLAMLTWDTSLNIDQNTRYMEIERDVNKFYIGRCKPRDKTINEYQERPVLPTPLQVMGWDDNRRINNPPLSPSNSGSPTNAPKPKLKGHDVSKPIQKNKQSQEKSKGDSEGGNNAAWARPQKPKK